MKPTAHLVFGFIGAGKTVFSRQIAASHNVPRLNIDEEIVRQYGTTPAAPDIFQQRFLQLEKSQNDEIRHLLLAGQSIVVDRGFWDRNSRDAIRSLITESGADYQFYYVMAPDKVMRARALQRSGDPNALQIAPEKWDALRPIFQSPGEDEPHILIDNSVNSPTPPKLPILKPQANQI